jgi:hypothetical protein
VVDLERQLQAQERKGKDFQAQLERGRAQNDKGQKELAAVRQSLDSQQREIGLLKAVIGPALLGVIPTVSIENIQNWFPQWQTKQFVPASSAPLVGIIAHLTQTCGGNVHARKVVTATSTTLHGRPVDYEPAHALDLTTDSLFATSQKPEAWMCLQFREKRVGVTHYSIRSHPKTRRGWNHLKSWVVEGSNDGSRWTPLDTRQNNTDLNGPGAVKTFPASGTNAFSYIRLRKTGPNHFDGKDLLGKKPDSPPSFPYLLEISAFELFGWLVTGQ